MSNSVRNAWVVTHVQPSGNEVQAAEGSPPPRSLGPTGSQTLGRFRVVHPKALGYVIAGSLTVAADNHLNQCLVKGSLGMNAVAAIVAFVGISLYSLDIAAILLFYQCVYFDCQESWSRSLGISSVLFLLSLLEFIVSICVSSFACHAVCECCQCCHPPTVIIVGEQMPVPHVGTATNNASFLPSYEDYRLVDLLVAHLCLSSGTKGFNLSDQLTTGSTKLGRFRLGHPKALGTVQIMTGLVILLIGIVMASSQAQDSLGVLSGIFVWGSMIYVIAGSLTVAADNQLNQCLVKGSLGMNVVATIISLVGIILYSIETAGTQLYFSCYNPFNQGQNNYYGSSNCPGAYWTRSSGISGVMLVLSLLEFIVSICVSSFGCKAVCQCCSCCSCCYTPEVIVIGEQILVPQVSSGNPNPAFVLPSFESLNIPKQPEGGSTNTKFIQYNPPPQYTSAFT
ncbi:hypothetical protein DPEC_G00275120 [Dallia pectoralis]|uniref:Uncharacterized protein n=1 Tax=Dallia pectoralis TaxID=75939 RepID=A0ACC2FL87_DALPE|nr:hypothetical protein DPEC_G00275120 [Dallia pectoralis]